MATTPTNERGSGLSIDTGEPIPVAIDSVDSQLAALWRNVAEMAQSKGAGTGVTMAQVVNLIIKAESHEAANEYTRMIDRITGQHPARVVVMTTDTTDEDLPVQAWVSIHCQLPPSGGRQVCAEQVWVASGAHAMRQLPAAVIPLLLPELPVFLWWPKGMPFDEYVFRQLADSLNRLIVDSATFENPEGMLSKMSARLKRDWPHLACTDTNWDRLTRWRELIAQFFDGAPLRPYLDRIGEVVIEYALPRSGTIINRSQAMLLTGWLASRLSWEPRDPVYEVLRTEDDKPAPVRVSLQSGTRPINVLIKASDVTSDVPGEICSVKLQVPGADPNGEAEAIFSAKVDREEDREDCAHISASVQGMSASERTIQVEPLQAYMLLDADLEIFSHDRIYEEALEMAGVIIRGTNRQGAGSPKLVSGEPVSAIPRQPRPPETRP